ncbi:ligand-binding domain of nuclear hormone receptor domain-containing protein [Ditylenchus destructor]|nr:ligand-binding domain of nuclear hormone receptor domain-containing protein [Ditylenchus destructor]
MVSRCTVCFALLTSAGQSKILCDRCATVAPGSSNSSNNPTVNQCQSIALYDSIDSSEIADSLLLSELDTSEQRLIKMRREPRSTNDYMSHSIESLLTEGTAEMYVTTIFKRSTKFYISNPWIAAPSLKASELMKSPFMAYDLFLNIEALNDSEEFSRLSLKDKICQIRKTVLPTTLFSQAFHSLSAGYTHLQFPNGVALSRMEFAGESPILPQLKAAHNAVFDNFMRPLLTLNLTNSEFMLMKQVMWYHPWVWSSSQDDSISDSGKAALYSISFRYFKILTNILVQTHGRAGAIYRLQLLSETMRHFFQLAKSMQFVHALFKRAYRVEKFAAPFFDELMRE